MQPSCMVIAIASAETFLTVNSTGNQIKGDGSGGYDVVIKPGGDDGEDAGDAY